MRFAILGIILAVIVSGCTDTTNASTGTGGSVVIKSFSADETNILGNDKVTLTAEIENTGDSRATAITLQLLELDVKCTGAAVTGCGDSTPTQWGIISGDVSKQIKSGLRISTPGEQTVPIQNTWRVQAPKIPANIVQTYDAKTRVSYTYSTSALKQITVITYDEYQRAKAKGETFPVTTTKSSNGPLGIDVKVNEPVKIEGGTTSFILTIIVNNLANGFTFTAGTDANLLANRDWINVNITLPSGLTMLDTGDCTTITRPGGLDAQLTSKGKAFTLSCEVSATAPAVSTARTVIVGTQYGYFTDSAKVSITVTGKTSYIVVPPGQTPPAGGVPVTPTPGGVLADVTPPSPVKDIATTNPVKETNAQGLATGKWLTTLTFTQPDDNVAVTAFEIVIAKKDAPGFQTPTADNWAAFAKYANPPPPQSTGKQIAVSNVVLDGNTPYIFCVRAKDAAGGLSSLANACIERVTTQAG